MMASTFYSVELFCLHLSSRVISGPACRDVHTVPRFLHVYALLGLRGTKQYGMRLKSLFVVGMLFVATIAQAQSSQEVVYLKNGSVIRGVIIEQVPNESLKIQTADGSIFAYQMDEVEKITKEQSANTRTHHGFTLNHKGRQQGYRGFVDVSGIIGVGDYSDSRIGISTSHGYQFNPYLFLGGGIATNYHFGPEKFFLPIYVHLRSEFLNHSYSPFADLRIGYSFFINPIQARGGFYTEALIGYRFAVGEKIGISVGVGYSLQMRTDFYRNKEFSWDHYEHGINIRVGFDF